MTIPAAELDAIRGRQQRALAYSEREGNWTTDDDRRAALVVIKRDIPALLDALAEAYQERDELAKAVDSEELGTLRAELADQTATAEAWLAEATRLSGVAIEAFDKGAASTDRAIATLGAALTDRERKLAEVRRKEKRKFIAMLRERARWHIETESAGDATLNDLADELERELSGVTA